MSRDLTIAQAIKTARARWGDKAIVERLPASTPADFAAVETEVRAEADKRRWVDGKLTREERIALAISLRRESMMERCRVGRMEMGLFFCIEASAPTFRECFTKCDAKDALAHEQFTFRRACDRVLKTFRPKTRLAQASAVSP